MIQLGCKRNQLSQSYALIQKRIVSFNHNTSCKLLHASTRKVIYPKFVFLGDSLTELAQLSHDPEWMDTNGHINIGWQVLLTEKYARKVDMINRGMSGWNTRWTVDYMHILRNELENEVFPELVMIWFGSNDCSSPLEGNYKYMHVPVAEYKENLQKLVSMYKETAQNAKIFLVTPPPFIKKASTERIVPYVEAVRSIVAANPDIHLVDIFQSFIALDDKELAGHFNDGTHFSMLGNQRVFNVIMGTIEKKEKQLMPSAFNSIMPDYTQWES